MFLAFGLSMEFPIVLSSSRGRDRHARPASGRRAATWSSAIAVFAAVVTPGGDLVSPSRPRPDDVRPVRGLDRRQSGVGRPLSSGRLRRPDEARGRLAAVSDPDEQADRRGHPRTSRPHVVRPERALRRRQDRGREALRGPGLRRSSTTCRASCCPTWPSSSSSDPSRYARMAIVLDVRSGDAPLAFAAMRGALEGRGIRPQVFFLEARDEVLIRRYSETRHRHPLGDQRGIASSHRRGAAPARAGPGRGRRRPRHVRHVAAGAARDALRPPRGHVEADQLAIQLISFGYKFGVPLEADLVFDVRFMQNPYYVPELRQLSGPDRGGARRSSSTSRVARRFLGVPPRLPGLHAAGLRGGGQDAPDDRHRLHRRLPPLDRHRRGAGAWLGERGRRSGQRLPSRAANAGDAMNLRRWLRPGMGFKRWLARRVHRRADASPSAAPSPSASSTATPTCPGPLQAAHLRRSPSSSCRYVARAAASSA